MKVNQLCWKVHVLYEWTSFDFEMSTHWFCNDLDCFVISFPMNVDYIDLLLPPGDKHLQPEICLGCRVLVLFCCFVIVDIYAMGCLPNQNVNELVKWFLTTANFNLCFVFFFAFPAWILCSNSSGCFKSSWRVCRDSTPVLPQQYHRFCQSVRGKSITGRN